MYALSNRILTLRHLLIQRSKKASPWFQMLVTIRENTCIKLNNFPSKSRRANPVPGE